MNGNPLSWFLRACIAASMLIASLAAAQDQDQVAEDVVIGAIQQVGPSSEGLATLQIKGRDYVLRAATAVSYVGGGNAGLDALNPGVKVRARISPSGASMVLDRVVILPN